MHELFKIRVVTSESPYIYHSHWKSLRFSSISAFPWYSPALNAGRGKSVSPTALL
jgi:hypothetical protein